MTTHQALMHISGFNQVNLENVDARDSDSDCEVYCLSRSLSYGNVTPLWPPHPFSLLWDLWDSPPPPRAQSPLR